jgi:hypothetical protein
MGIHTRNIQYATVFNKQLALSGEFGKLCLARKFGEAEAQIILQAFSTFSKGMRKGQQKGYLFWKKVEIGGWYRPTVARGRVVVPGTFGWTVRLGLDENSSGLQSRENFAEMSDKKWTNIVKEWVASSKLRR